MRISRRQLIGGGVLGAGMLLEACGGSGAASARAGGTSATSPASGRRAGSRPLPHLPAGTARFPQIEHIVVVMMENHSFDNVLGMLGRGDGFPLGSDGRPRATNPDGKGDLVHAFPMPTECQTKGVGNNWKVSHEAYADGTCQGFVTSTTAEAMGYYTRRDLPFTWAMAETFPIADRYFCSVMAQTYPNRRYLLAGTSLGLVDDTFPTALPPNGIIFQTLDRHGITWRDYSTSLPSVGVFLPLLSEPSMRAGLAGIDRFYADARAGTLPQVSLVEPDYGTQSEEDPQDVQFGDQFLGRVVHAVTSGPKWRSTLLVWTYDEHGGYYDHVPPPPAVPPDDVPPDLPAGYPPGGFDRYGFRVPAGVVSAYARRNFVSHTVYDHTSVLATIEQKWNLPALTRRDANAHSLFDMLDLQAAPAFARPPTLPPPTDPAPRAGCLTTGAGTIPPAWAVTRA